MLFVRPLLLSLFIVLGAGAAEDIIMEHDSPGVTRYGRWYPSTIAPGYHGKDYLYAINGIPGHADGVTFRPLLTGRGRYEISIWYPASPHRVQQAPVALYTDLGYQTTIYVNQRENGGQWVVLGEWDLVPGYETSLNFYNSYFESGIIVVDAVRFRLIDSEVYVPPTRGTDIFIDDADARRVSFAGTWLSSRRVPGFAGTGYRYAEPASTRPRLATFTPYLPVGGMYEVLTTFPAYGGRSPATPISIHHRDGNTTVTIDQRHESQHVLGHWIFSAGAQGSVSIDGAGSRGNVIADTMRFRLLSIPRPGPLPTIPTTINGIDFDPMDTGAHVSFLGPEWTQIGPQSQEAPYFILAAYYTINVPSTGRYDIAIPYLASSSTCDSLQIHVNDISAGYVSTGPGGPSVFRLEKVLLQRGTQVIKLSAIDSTLIGSYGETMSTAVSIQRLEFTRSPSGRSAFGGDPHPVPGTIEAEDYDLGGIGTAYSRMSWEPITRDYRSDDIGIIDLDAGARRALHIDGSTRNPLADTRWNDETPLPFAPAWVEYTITTPSAGTFDVVLTARATPHDVPVPMMPEELQVAIDGVPVGQVVGLPSDSTDAFREVVIPRLTVPAGSHRLRVTLLPSRNNTDFWSRGVDLDRIDIRPSTASASVRNRG